MECNKEIYKTGCCITEIAPDCGYRNEIIKEVSSVQAKDQIDNGCTSSRNRYGNVVDYLLIQAG